MGVSGRIDNVDLLKFYNEVMQAAYNYGQSTIQGLKRYGITVKYSGSKDSDRLTLDTRYPHSKEISKFAQDLLGSYPDYVDSSLYVSGNFFSLLSGIVNEDLMSYIDAEEAYESYGNKVSVSIKGILYAILPHEGDGKHWSQTKELSQSFRTNLMDVLDTYVMYEYCYLRVYDKQGTPLVEYCTNDGYAMADVKDDYSSCVGKGIIKKDVKGMSNMLSALLDVLLDEYKAPIKEVYFIGNNLEFFGLNYVVASKNSDGELSLVIY